MLWPKKNSYKEFDNEKNSCGSQIPLPPHNFSNGPSLSCFIVSNVSLVRRRSLSEALYLSYNTRDFHKVHYYSYYPYTPSKNSFQVYRLVQ